MWTSVDDRWINLNVEGKLNYSDASLLSIRVSHRPNYIKPRTLWDLVTAFAVEWLIHFYHVGVGYIYIKAQVSIVFCHG
jgi:hypothetical protein